MSNFEDSAVSDRLRRLVDAAIDGTAADDELRELDAVLQADAAARRYYRRMAEVHASLRWIHRAETAAGQTAAAFGQSLNEDSASLGATGEALAEAIAGDEMELSIRGGPGGVAAAARSVRSTGRGRSAAAAVICGLAAMLAGVVVYRNAVVQQREALDAAVEVVAELNSNRDSVWVNAPADLAAGRELASGQRLELASGAAKLQFRRGAVVVLKGPAEVELISSSSMRLVHGTIAVRVNGPNKKFVVTSADAEIVDLGTSFGVHRGRQGATEVEVFEGAVEVFPEGRTGNGQVLGVGASARVSASDPDAGVDMTASDTDRFGDLLELLWEGMADLVQDGVDATSEGVIHADFTDGRVPGAIDTFYGAVPGRGWLTPWLASGNPLGDIEYHKPLGGERDPYLRLGFYRSTERAVARQYGARRGFDPMQPHVISWQWRFDGNIDDFGDSFKDRIAFYGNPFFRRNSWPTNSWLIGVVGANETSGKERQVYPLQWFAFNGGNHSSRSREFERRNMVDAGMRLKPNVVYRFAVVVYPEQAVYDVAIRDDSQTFTRRGLAFRNFSAGGSMGGANVVHFGISGNQPTDDLSFSLDSIRIAPLDATHQLLLPEQQRLGAAEER